MRPGRRPAPSPGSLACAPCCGGGLRPSRLVSARRRSVGLLAPARGRPASRPSRFQAYRPQWPLAQERDLWEPGTLRTSQAGRPPACEARYVFLETEGAPPRVHPVRHRQVRQGAVRGGVPASRLWPRPSRQPSGRPLQRRPGAMQGQGLRVPRLYLGHPHHSGVMRGFTAFPATPKPPPRPRAGMAPARLPSQTPTYRDRFVIAVQTPNTSRLFLYDELDNRWDGHLASPRATMRGTRPRRWPPAAAPSS